MANELNSRATRHHDHTVADDAVASGELAGDEERAVDDVKMKFRLAWLQVCGIETESVDESELLCRSQGMCLFVIVSTE